MRYLAAIMSIPQHQLIMIMDTTTFTVPMPITSIQREPGFYGLFAAHPMNRMTQSMTRDVAQSVHIIHGHARQHRCHVRLRYACRCAQVGRT